MKEVEVPQAIASFSELLDHVERGRTVVIMRDGKAVARLVPAPDERRRKAQLAMAEIKEARKHTGRVTVAEILAWHDEGRK